MIINNVSKEWSNWILSVIQLIDDLLLTSLSNPKATVEPGLG